MLTMSAMNLITLLILYVFAYCHVVDALMYYLKIVIFRKNNIFSTRYASDICKQANFWSSFTFDIDFFTFSVFISFTPIGIRNTVKGGNSD